MTFIDHEKLFDIPAREALLDLAFGPSRRAKTCERLREGRLPAEGLAYVARCGDRVVGTLRFWHVMAGTVPALMLGPIAIDPVFRSEGLGGRMIRRGLADAAERGHKGVILVGDAAYYGRFGFEQRLTSRLCMPGPVDEGRFLGLELALGALAGARGGVRPTGAVPLVAFSAEGLRRRAA